MFPHKADIRRCSGDHDYLEVVLPPFPRLEGYVPPVEVPPEDSSSDEEHIHKHALLSTSRWLAGTASASSAAGTSSLRKGGAARRRATPGRTLKVMFENDPEELPVDMSDDDQVQLLYSCCHVASH